MESLLPSNDMPGLNIVTSVTANITPKMRKPKKKNKYEKRRAKARNAKKQKENPLKKDDKDSETERSTAIKIATAIATAPQENDKSLATSDVQESKTHKKDSDDNEGTTIEENKNSSTSVNSKNNNATTADIVQKEESVLIAQPFKAPVTQRFSTTDPIINNEISNSRKMQQMRAEELMKDEIKRAEYMSTYHARPYEMDRKSGATSRIQHSKESTHIFGDVEEEDSEITNDSNLENGGTNASDCPFASCGLHPNIVRTLTSSRMNLKRPTMIQRNAWDQILIKMGRKDNSSSIRRKNLFVQSETGSGKTLAYLLPIVQHLAVDSKTFELKKVDRQIGGTRALIMCPTRELATQTGVIAEKVCQNSFPWLVAGCLSGGEKRKSEKARLRKGISILISTPGRLLDHLSKTDSLLMALKGKLEWVVLDESDRLLDLGLGSQVEQIIQMVRANQSKSGIKRDGITWQSALVSATINDRAKNMASKLLGGDAWVWARASKFSKKTEDLEKKDSTFDSNELSSATPHQLTQHHMVVSSKLRLTALVSFLLTRIQKKERIVVFMSTCDGVDFHHKLLSKMQPIVPWEKGNEELNEFKSGSGIFGSACSLHRLHGNIPHKERNKIMSEFSNVESNQEAAVLITTDVAARGLNLPSVNWIVQYDPPCETADYIHRAGRAARAGKAGHALLFLLPSETQYVEVLKIRGLDKLTALSLSSTLQDAAKISPDVTAEGLEKSGSAKVNSSRMAEAFTSAVQIRLEDCIMNDDKAYKEALSKKAVPHGSDKELRRKQRREAKKAVGPLLESARLAFSSYIRGYSTKEKLVRHIFSARALHLGHVAKSFALREQPKELSKAHRNSRQSNQRDSEELKSTGRKRSSQLAFGKTKDEKRTKSDAEHTDTRKKANFPEIPNNDAVSKHRNVGNIKANMLAAASRMEGGDMEFF